MLDFVCAVLTSYIVTMVITKGSALERFREWFVLKTPWLWIKNYPHFIDCRLCVGAWVSLVVAAAFGSITLWLPIYGLSYFMATQERG